MQTKPLHLTAPLLGRESVLSMALVPITIEAIQTNTRLSDASELLRLRIRGQALASRAEIRRRVSADPTATLAILDCASSMDVTAVGPCSGPMAADLEGLMDYDSSELDGAARVIFGLAALVSGWNPDDLLDAVAGQVDDLSGADGLLILNRDAEHVAALFEEALALAATAREEVDDFRLGLVSIADMAQVHSQEIDALKRAQVSTKQAARTAIDTAVAELSALEVLLRSGAVTIDEAGCAALGLAQGALTCAINMLDPSSTIGSGPVLRRLDELVESVYLMRVEAETISMRASELVLPVVNLRADFTRSPDDALA